MSIIGRAARRSFTHHHLHVLRIDLTFRCCEGAANVTELAWPVGQLLPCEIYTSLSETTCATGEYEIMTMMALNEILSREKAKNFDDELRACCTMTSALAAQQDLKAALSMGFNVLEHLDEPIDVNADIGKQASVNDE